MLTVRSLSFSTVIICYLTEDQSEFLEERRQKDLVSGLTWSRGIWCGFHMKRVMSRMECGQPGNFPVDVVSKSFPIYTVRGCFRH